jgi:hypothetical protein
MDITPPLIVVDDDIDIFSTVAEAEKSLEPADVDSRRLRIYDRNGRLIRPIIQRRILAEVVRLEWTPSQAEPETVRDLLKKFLTGVERREMNDYSTLDLGQLWQMALQYATK